DLEGISYIRTTREATPPLYGPDEEFPIGGSKVHGAGGDDRAAIVAAGITVHEALAAAGELRKEGIGVRVIDAYCVKPIDSDRLREALEATGLIVTIEDHRIEGGLGDAVLGALASTGPLSGSVVKVGVTQMPGSGSPQELRDWAGISADRIA